MSRTTNSLKNMGTGLIGQAVTLILQFVYRTIFIKLLGLTYLSVNGLFTNILTIFSLAELGIGQAIVFSLYKPIRDNNIPKIQALMALYKKTYTAIGIFIFATGIAFLPFLPSLVSEATAEMEHLYLIYLLFVADSGIAYFFSYRQSFLQANQKQYILNTTNTIFAVIHEILRIVFILFTRSYIAMLLFNMVFNLLRNIWITCRINKLYPFLKKTCKEKLPPEETSGILKNVKALLIYKIGNLALNSTDNIIITTMVGLNWVGLYSNYQVLTVAVSGFISTLFTSLTASIGNLNAGDDISQKKKIFQVTNLASFWIYAIASVCFMVALTPTVTLWLGREWALDFPTVLVICGNIYVGGMLFAPYNYRQTMGLFVYGKWRPIISAVINLLVSVILGHYIGLKGVLLGTIIARLTTNVWYDPYIVYKKGFHQNPTEYYLHYLMLALLLAVSGGIGWLISRLSIFGGLADILLHCVACTVILSGLYILIFRKTDAFQYLTQVAFSLLKKKKSSSRKEGE